MKEFKNKHSVAMLSAQLVLVTYRRQKVLTPAAVDIFKEAAAMVAKNHSIEIEKVNGEPDHLHVLISFNVTTQLDKFINSLKSCSSRLLKKEIPTFRWSAGYWIGSFGAANEDVIKNYVDNQAGV